MILECNKNYKATPFTSPKKFKRRIRSAKKQQLEGEIDQDLQFDKILKKKFANDKYGEQANSITGVTDLDTKYSLVAETETAIDKLKLDILSREEK